MNLLMTNFTTAIAIVPMSELHSKYFLCTCDFFIFLLHNLLLSSYGHGDAVMVKWYSESTFPFPFPFPFRGNFPFINTFAVKDTVGYSTINDVPWWGRGSVRLGNSVHQ